MALRGCYTLRVFCDHLDKDEFFKLFSCIHVQRIEGRTRAECIREAKQPGWHITATHAYCPEHDPRAKKTAIA